jgi:hypothetical protein
MPADEIHAGDIGTVLEVTIQDDTSVIDISAMTLAGSILLEKPDGTVLTKTGVLVTDGTDGKVKYTTVADDLDTAGQWRIQASVTISGSTWKSDVGSFRVYPNLN